MKPFELDDMLSPSQSLNCNLPQKVGGINLGMWAPGTALGRDRISDGEKALDNLEGTSIRAPVTDVCSASSR